MSGIAFRELTAADAAQLLAWRTQPRVAEMMVGEVSPDLDAQARWLAACFDRPDYYHWMVRIGGSDAGLLSLAQYDRDAARASWGFYIGDESQLGLGGLVPPHFYNWAFGPLGLQGLHAEVLERNAAVIELHRLHGYQRDPQRDRCIVKQGQELALLALRLDRERWNATRYRRLVADFPTAAWRARPPQLAPALNSA